MLLKTQNKYLRIDRRQICFVKFIFEAHDGLATITTVNPQKGRVLFRIAPGCETEVDMILEDLKKEILIEPEGLEFDA